MTAPTDRQLTQLRVAFTRHGVTKRPDVLRLSAEHAGRHLYSTRAMTGTEVDALIARLGRLPVGPLPGHAARLEREEEARARRAAAVERIPAGTIICTPGGKQPTTADLEAVAEFGEFLSAAGPPPGTDPFAPAIAVLRAHGLLPGDNTPDGDDGDNGGVLPFAV